MKKLNEKLENLYVKAICSWENFKASEKGDTNFVSMLLIIGIVVVLAGLFLILGKDVMAAISGKIKEFMGKL